MAFVPGVWADLANKIDHSVKNLLIGVDFEQLQTLFVLGDTVDFGLVMYHSLSFDEVVLISD